MQVFCHFFCFIFEQKKRNSHSALTKASEHAKRNLWNISYNSSWYFFYKRANLTDWGAFQLSIRIKYKKNRLLAASWSPNMGFHIAFEDNGGTNFVEQRFIFALFAPDAAL